MCEYSDHSLEALIPPLSWIDVGPNDFKIVAPTMPETMCPFCKVSGIFGLGHINEIEQAAGARDA